MSKKAVPDPVFDCVSLFVESTAIKHSDKAQVLIKQLGLQTAHNQKISLL